MLYIHLLTFWNLWMRIKQNKIFYLILITLWYDKEKNNYANKLLVLFSFIVLNIVCLAYCPMYISLSIRLIICS